ncbi:MAG: squalene/phytoene synthase family protein [Deltaproteobacteria bacterium]|nr:squalene/phytoene synthase family protein [Deltaproteobacteria bacterium]
MADLQRLLLKTSRTFALSIPLLEEPPRQEVGVAYLLFRIADTFEDGARWPRQARLVALAEFAELVRRSDAQRAESLARRWVSERPCDDESYLELLGEFPAVLAELARFVPARREAIVKHVVRTAEGMARFVERSDEQGSLQLADVDDLRRYCYVVAGIVGELLTELFVDAAPQLARVLPQLNEREAVFGEGLQLVNILKDSDSDAREGRTYLPRSVPRQEIFAVARGDLGVASEYVLELQRAGAPRGIVEFTALPVLLAFASLDELERNGPGSKIGRLKVAALMTQLRADVNAGVPVLPSPTPRAGSAALGRERTRT